ncbi:MAG: LysR family transcriptional regulator [Lautropia sp.]|nr:MAG: LysR family transcriptional regulator [Pseudomonadota bacterium]MBC6959216.1 LysR family transcriptional regulator [Lautropia sp.]MCL4701485.1 LysR family transcriptional regulator [Burkholderiaceae bacterium]MDL1907304.1 LysR family transcriptional regulator [Betaproteobacteria bacterium PRO1]RIK89666.1 MAG: LysR family transcriptional regulator [Burkholderiales bacterium]
MDRFKQIETFVAVATRGSLSAAAQAEGVAPAVIGRRIDALEERLGVKLLVSTTRRITLTFEGSAFLEDCQRLLNDFYDAEASVSLGGVKASGHLRVTAPAGFGRAHVAPLLPAFLDAHPEVTISLDLTDRLADIVNEGIDVAIRIGALDDSSLVGLELAENRRVVVASPGYLEAHGTPSTPAELAQHNCLTFGTYGNQARGWQFDLDGQLVSMRVSGTLACNDGAVLRDWALAGRGLAWRSMWEVGEDLRAGRLKSVLDAFAAPDNAIHAVFPQRKHLPLRVRVFVDYLKTAYGDPAYWR